MMTILLAGCASVPINSSLQSSSPQSGPPPQTAESITVTVTPPSISVQAGQSQTFTATVNNDPKNQGVNWILSGGCSGAACGMLSANSSASGAGVTYTAPPLLPNPPSIRLMAVSVSDSTKTAAVPVTITPGIPITVSVSPSVQNIIAGQPQQFTATVQNDLQNKGVTWSVSGPGCNGATCGTLSSKVSASGTAITYTAPANVPTPPTITLTATSASDSNASGAVTFTIAAGLSINIAPGNTKVVTKTTQDFTATVQNDPNKGGVTWTLSGAGCSGNSCGTLSKNSSASGVAITYTAPNKVPNPATVTLTATSVSQTSISSSITVTVIVPPPIVTVSPSTQKMVVSSKQAFTAKVQRDPQNNGVNWSLSGSGCSGNACGTISSTSSSSGTAITYTAPAKTPSPATVTLTATSVTDSSVSASATITIFANPGDITVSVSPERGGLTVTQTLKFTATVANDPTDQGVTWSASDGTLTNSGSNAVEYQAPNNAGVYKITATSVADVSKSATAVIGVTDLGGMTTYHNNQARDGVNSREFALTPGNVTPGTFGKLFSCRVDAPIYPQTLWEANLNIAGGTHNVIFTATSNDTVYAFDADQSPCVRYWSRNLIPSGETVPTNNDIQSNDIEPTWGVVGTPVIDPDTGILYVVTLTKDQGTNCSAPGTCHQRLHALNITNGRETANGPVELTSALTVPGTGDGSSGGQLPFDSWRENQRPGLALINNTVYVSFGSHEDRTPWHGWVMGFNKSNLQGQPLLYNTSPNGEGGGIWMSGAAPSFDAQNNLYVLTGNGDYDGQTNFGDSMLKLDGNLNLLDWFTPSNQASMNTNNGDFGGGGAAVVADLPKGKFPHLIIGGGKTGMLYVINRDAMGNLEGTGPALVQKFSPGGWVFSTGAFWKGTFYIAAARQTLRAFTVDPNTSQFTESSASSAAFGGKGATPSVSASRGSNGIVWATDTSQYSTPGSTGTGPAVLHAYDANNLGRELWNSSMNSGDQAGVAVKFTVPTIANGKVYIGSRTEIDVYGLLPN